MDLAAAGEETRIGAGFEDDGVGMGVPWNSALGHGGEEAESGGVVGGADQGGDCGGVRDGVSLGHFVEQLEGVGKEVGVGVGMEEGSGDEGGGREEAGFEGEGVEGGGEREEGWGKGASFEGETEEERVEREGGMGGEKKGEEGECFGGVGGAEIAGYDGCPGDGVSVRHLVEQVACVMETMGIYEGFELLVGFKGRRVRKVEVV